MSTDIDSWLDAIARTQKTLAEFDSRTEEERGEVVRQLNVLVSRLRTRVKSGATTGDPIQDYVLLAFRRVGSEVLERYQTLAEWVVLNSGELVLQYKLEEKASSESMFPEVNFEESFAIGVLKGPDLIFPVGEITCRFPTERYVVVNGDSKLYEGNLKVSRLWGFGSTVGFPRSVVVSRTQLRGFPEDSGKPVPRVQIVIGDGAVRDWFLDRGPSYEGILEKAAELIDYEIQPTEEELAELEAQQVACLEQLEQLALQRAQLWAQALEYIEYGMKASEVPLRRFLAKHEEVQSMVRRAMELRIDPEELKKY